MSELGGFTIELAWPAPQLSPNARWTTERDDRLRELHGTMTISAIAAEMGTTRGAIRARVTYLGIAKKNDQWTEQEVARLRVAYAVEFGDDIGLDALAAEMGRHKANISRKARSLGLTNIRRPLREHKVSDPKIGPEGSPELRAHQSAIRRDWFKNNPHPRGMAGKKHSAETLAVLRVRSREFHDSVTPDQRAQWTLKAMKTKVARYGTIAPLIERGTWKAGWREIADRRIFFRSRWEANYARYLQWLKERGDILDWEYEPETFWFDAIKRGVRSYKPDFRIHELNGSKPLHEVKGWMDARSKTTLKRMAKYHPQETIILIREKEYRALSRFAALIGGWE